MRDDTFGQSDDTNQPAQSLTPLALANAELSQQLAACRQQLNQLDTTLAEARQVIAEHSRVEAERTRLLKQERELNELKSSFVTLASHEFRTPMMTILSSASLIGRYNGATDSDNRERHVQRIKSAVSSLTNMLDVFLFMGQVEQGIMSSHLQAIDVTQFCAAVIADVQAVAKPQQRFLYEHLDGQPHITGDSTVLRHILYNLLANASKYSAEAADIHLDSAVVDKVLILSVTDWGIGIPDADKDKLFTNFFRARNAIHIPGTGLGLYLVKRYVDRLGGTVSFTSTLDKGTVFTVQLPIKDPV
ncbi:sensor histidine kinase [Fibrella sp. WM1]|uniref:sensor histidine kinase n=1 Tax=Fibrella musci TaxID=3242485 RepID=UPI003521450F